MPRTGDDSGRTAKGPKQLSSQIRRQRVWGGGIAFNKVVWLETAYEHGMGRFGTGRTGPSIFDLA